MPNDERRHRLRWVDVFTDRALAGNPLAVVLGADGLSTGQMQAIARETNLSETTFVLPAETREYAAKVRIFTPHVELPFAGHPTVGTAGCSSTRDWSVRMPPCSRSRKASGRFQCGSIAAGQRSCSGCRIPPPSLAS